MANAHVVSPLAGWLGGKLRLSKLLLRLIPEHQCYVEPFAGAAWLFFRKPRSRVEVLNDLNKEVVTLYRVTQHHFPEFVRCLSHMLASRDEYEQLAAQPPELLTDVQRAVRFYYLQKLGFNGRISSPAFGYSSSRPPRLDARRIASLLDAARNRLAGVYVECLGYLDCLRRWDRPGVFFYLDPPYYGRERVYGRNLFSREDFERLAFLLSRVKGRFLMSLNDTPQTRRLFGQFNQIAIQAPYSCTKGPGRNGRELLIANYPLPDSDLNGMAQAAGCDGWAAISRKAG